MKLYIGNAKAQIEAFTYRVPDSEMRPGQSPAPRVQQIPAGTQVQISGELTSYQVDAIVEQHRKYGLIGIDEIDRRKPFAGLCFSRDRPIAAQRLHDLMTHNFTVLQEKGREFREMAAIASHQRVENDMVDQGMPGQLRKLEMEVVEERNSRSDGEEMTPHRIRVAHEEDAPAKPKRGPKSKAN